MMTTAQDTLARLEREQQRLMRRIRQLDKSDRWSAAEGDALVAMGKALLPHVQKARQAAYDAQRRAARQPAAQEGA